MKSKIYLVTCLNEENELIDHKIHYTKLDAIADMKASFERERTAMCESDNLVEDFIGSYSAYLVYGDEPLMYRWELIPIEIDTDKLVNNAE